MSAETRAVEANEQLLEPSNITTGLFALMERNGELFIGTIEQIPADVYGRSIDGIPIAPTYIFKPELDPETGASKPTHIVGEDELAQAQAVFYRHPLKTVN